MQGTKQSIYFRISQNFKVLEQKNTPLPNRYNAPFAVLKVANQLTLNDMTTYC